MPRDVLAGAKLTVHDRLMHNRPPEMVLLLPKAQQ